jgi:hypothetical protein
MADIGARLSASRSRALHYAHQEGGRRAGTRGASSPRHRAAPGIEGKSATHGTATGHHKQHGKVRRKSAIFDRVEILSGD